MAYHDHELDQLYMQVSGMTCTNCAMRIEKALNRMDGIDQVSASFTLGQVSVTMDKAKVDIAQIKDKIKHLGFEVVSSTDGGASQHRKEFRRLLLRFLIAAVLTVPLFWTMVTHYSFTSGIWIPELFLNPWFQLAVAIPVQFWIGLPFHRGAIQALRNRAANMDVLVSLGTSSAFIYSTYLAFTTLSVNPHMMHGGGHTVHLYFETSSMIITIVWLGKLLEARSKGRMLKAVHGLQALQVDTVQVIRDRKELTVPLSQVDEGDLVIIRPGEKVPVDGQIVSGHSALDESMITGEYVPVDKRPGDQVLSGSINRNGTIQVVAVKVGEQSILQQMIRLIEKAQHSKPPIQRIADEIAEIFVPIIVTFALVTFGAWYFVFHPGDFANALERAISVLVIACPCAIGLATPTSIMVGSGKAAERGVLFREGKHIESLSQVDVVLLDKTGTITEGKPTLSNISVVGGGSETRLLRMAAAAERLSEHPFSHAIVSTAMDRGIELPEAKLFHAITGYGITAIVEGSRVFVGTLALLKQQGIDASQLNTRLIERWELEGKSVLFVAIQEKLAGMFAIMDTIKPSSKRAVAELRRQGLEVVMISGDNRLTAEAIAKEVGLKRVYSEVLPEGKVSVVKELQRRGKKVAMVGDGMNDAPALAAADIGIAMGTGTDMAIQAADVNLLRGDLLRISEAVAISRKTIVNIKQNLTFALIYNMFAIPFAIIGWLEPWMAGTAMTLSSISVVGNALRLQRKI